MRVVIVGGSLVGLTLARALTSRGHEPVVLERGRGEVRGEEQAAEIVYSLQAAGVGLVVATDGPEMIGTRLRAEYGMLTRLGALTPEQAHEANERAHRVSFVAGPIRAPGGGFEMPGRPPVTRGGAPRRMEEGLPG